MVSYFNDCFKPKNAILTSALNKDQMKYVLTQETKDGNVVNGNGVQIWPPIEKTNQTKLNFDCSIYINVDYNSRRQSISGYLISPNDNDNDNSDDIK